MSLWSEPHSPPPGPLTRDLPPPPGVTPVPGGCDVAVYAGHADAVDLCLFEPGDRAGESERRVPLVERAHGWWFATVPGMTTGQRYGLRAHGPWDPERGHLHNPAKLLLDPYAGALEGEVTWGPEIYGHAVDATGHGDLDRPSALDSRGHVPRGVLVDHAFDWGDDAPPGRSRSESVIYEAHVRNQTMRHPGVPPELRGTYAGLAHPASVEHLLSLGATAVELLPVHAFTHEPHLARRGLRNHWGYNTLGFLAPHAPYAAARDPQGAVDEVKGMVKLLHEAGIEVVLDVVYNHTAEQSRTGATLSWRGLDERAYYRLDERGRDIDVTGCGNTLDLRHPVVCRMVLDSLRHWVREYHVDGFRFDLAVALGRGRGDDFDPDHPFLVALRTDPVLSRVTLVAEPWDVGLHGWRTGQFPPPFLEWNDRYRDTVRRFWVGDARARAAGHQAHDARELATRLTGSRDLFGARDRGPTASVNFVTAHDGFTLADLVSYDHKHNEANGEDNRDGSDGNGSWNHGVEGPTDDAAVVAARARTLRNLLGTLLLSSGVPMLVAGDEMGRTQGGNNNPYCQDNEISWLDWDLAPWQEDLLATVRHLVALRRDLPVLRQRTWLLGRPVARRPRPDAEPADERHAGPPVLDVAWFGADGAPMDGRWDDAAARVLQMALAAPSPDEQGVLLVVNGTDEDVEVTMPDGVVARSLLWDSAPHRPDGPGGDAAARDLVPASSMRLVATDPGPPPVR